MVKVNNKKSIPLFVKDGILDDYPEKTVINRKYRDLSVIHRGSCKELVDRNLTKTQKSYIMLYYNDKKTVSEIARIYGVNKSTVSRTINRAKKNIINIFPAYAS